MNDLIMAVLSTYAIAMLLSQYDGPFHIIRSVRDRSYGLMDCPVCLSVYIAFIPAIGLDIGLYGYLATVGGTILLARTT